MSEKLLAWAAVILLFSSFSYTTDDRFSPTTGLSPVLFVARVLPIALVMGICILAVPVRWYMQLVKALGTPPFLFWSWYASVAAVSGVVSGVAPLWSAWKCLELLVIVTWAAAVSIHLQRSQSPRVLIQIFTLLVVACYFVALWSMGEMLREGHSLRDFVVRGDRLDTTWPHINSITLSTMSLFAVCGGILVTYRMPMPWRVLLLLPPMLVFGLSRSRTGLLALVALAVFAMATSTLSKGKKMVLVLLCSGVLLTLAANADLQAWMRVQSWEELARGAGRIRTEDGRRSGWLDTMRVIRESPQIGVGFIIVRRFLDADHAAVDNFILQSLVAAGVIGALPMIGYSFYVFFRWLAKLRCRDAETRRLLELGMVGCCLAFVKSFTTNGISAYDFSLILFLTGAVALRWVIHGAAAGANAAAGEPLATSDTAATSWAMLAPSRR